MYYIGEPLGDVITTFVQQFVAKAVTNMVENVEGSIGQDPANEVTHLGLNHLFSVLHNPFTHTTNKHNAYLANGTRRMM